MILILIYHLYHYIVHIISIVGYFKKLWLLLLCKFSSVCPEKLDILRKTCIFFFSKRQNSQN